MQCPVSNNSVKRDLREQAIHHLSDIQFIEVVPEETVETGIYSILFIVPKHSGGVGWRAILDLKNLNAP